MIRTFSIGDAYLPEQDPWSGILATTMFAIHATYHTTTQAMPAQLVFGRDAILNTCFIADWKMIRQRKQNLIKKIARERISNNFIMITRREIWSYVRVL